MKGRLSSQTVLDPHAVLSWVYAGRALLAVAIFLVVLAEWREAGPQTTLAATLILVLSLTLSAWSAWRTHVAGHRPERAFLYAQVLYDVVLVAAVVHQTGGKNSNFAPLFVLVIVAGALLLPLLGGILMGLLASLLYMADVAWSSASLDATVLLQIALFATIAMVTGTIGDRLRRTGTVLGEVETELRLLRLDTDDILASIGTGILTVDGEGRLAYINPAAGELLDLPAHQWLGRPVLERLDELAPGLGGVIRRSLETRQGTRRYETEETSDAMVFGVSTTVVERAPGELPTITAIFQDITARKRMDALRSRAERLEAVAELSASLAHEIKNPLASIRSAAEQLGGGGMDPEDRAVLLGLVVRESDRLSRLLTEFIDFARVRLRDPGPKEIGTLVRHAVELARAHPDAEGRALSLRFGSGADEARVHGDGDLLHRAVLNLALNALQWAGPGGRVEIEADVARSELLSRVLDSTEAVRIRVTDSGPGVPPDEVEHVFDPFFTLRPGGTGLGLALVHRAAEAHGGAVFVDDPRPGWGATFTLYLPALSGPRAPAPAGGAAPDAP